VHTDKSSGHRAGKAALWKPFVKTGCLFLLVFLILPTATAQVQDQESRPDPELNMEETFEPSPAKAAMLSATLPGMGQIYNRKYWKVPIIYAGFGTLYYFLDMNNSEYQKWRQAWIARVDGNPNTVDDFPRHSTAMLERAMDFYRRNLEITYILTAALYLLNILDASVDAHLMNFDVGEELSLGMDSFALPSTSGNVFPRQGPQFTVTIRF